MPVALPHILTSSSYVLTISPSNNFVFWNTEGFNAFPALLAASNIPESLAISSVASLTLSGILLSCKTLFIGVVTALNSHEFVKILSAIFKSFVAVF